ncbi:hypothetical protein A9Q88_02525 [Gammaproteobacteria bacterium 50_400_T64]|nr:hypothetical protein A9Q88_02525 [Gammaproteobacteria bacterium 50_400_T64]
MFFIGCFHSVGQYHEGYLFFKKESMSREINQAGLDFLKSFEGFYADAYIFPAGVLTIGYGHIGDDVAEGPCINKTTAEELLSKDMESAATSVERLVTVPLSAALASFAG